MKVSGTTWPLYAQGNRSEFTREENDEKIKMWLDIDLTYDYV